ncbi:hypothetical protein HOA59_00370 [archaeon]|jgi:2-(3-amino-3-carboxypropyl)histidine synthase|nr:hypothetical protein [archaeon]MBT6823875.1 hypothetical protein [archaeon]MBT7107406.1 hypothetical protein [archaeon]MBT7297200.1 hypothetical protein [archaeon]
MKTLFVNAKYSIDSLKRLDKIKIKEKKIGIIGTIQTTHLLEQVKTHLENSGHEVDIVGQVVGCNVNNMLKFKDSVNAFLFIGSGMFHLLEVLDKTEITKYYQFNPTSESFSSVSTVEIERLKKKRMAKLAKFYSSDKIGILVTTKPGQENLNGSLKFARKSNKSSYIFLTNDIDTNKLEDFSDIEYWINSACPRLEERGIISLRDVDN